MSSWITIIGIGEDGLDGLSPRAREIINAAEVLVGGDRHLSMMPATDAESVSWGKDFDHGVKAIRAHEGRRVVVLASGDPMHFGVGATLSKRFGLDSLEIIPVPGAFSLAAARMGWSLPDVTCLTVHGRALASVNLHLRPGGRLLILSWDGTTPAKLAALLNDKGFGDSVLSVLEHMGGADENTISSTASDWSLETTADLNTIAVELVAGPGAVYWPRAAGLPEEAFRHDNMITKREVRAVTLAQLAPMPGETLWDVGAGSGTVSVEWLRLEPTARAIAIERNAGRAANARHNANEMGVPRLDVIEADAPAAFDQIEGTPDAIFVGGGLSAELLEVCWARLRSGGRMVANAVTLEGHAAVMAQRDAHGGRLSEISISREDAVGPRHGLRPMMTVMQLISEKT